MSRARLKTLEGQVLAAGSAFACDEAAFDTQPIAPARIGRIAAFSLALAGGLYGLAQYFGVSNVLATLGGWRAAA